MLWHTHYAQNYACIIRTGLVASAPVVVSSLRFTFRGAAGLDAVDTARGVVGGAVCWLMDIIILY